MKDKKIFISYSHKDEKKKDEVVELLEKYSEYEVWVDDRLHTGQEYFSVIADKILEAEILVILMSKNAIKSSFVKQELEYAKTKNKKIMSIWLENVNLPTNFEFILHNAQYLLWYSYSNKQQLIEEIKKAFENKDISTTSKREDYKTEKHSTPKKKKKLLWIVLVVVLLVLVELGYSLIQALKPISNEGTLELEEINVHMTFPEKWEVDSLKEDADLNRSLLYANDESGLINFSGRMSWQGEYLTSMEMNNETIKELEEIYREYLPVDDWKEISFEEKIVNEQKYLMIKGTKTTYGTNGGCIFLTIVDNTLVEFEFVTENEFIDSTTKNSIDNVMDTVTYFDK